MRITLNLTGTRTPVPFDYPHAVCRKLHDWLGKDNKWHSTMSLYSIGNLRGGKLNRQTGMLDFRQGGRIAISAWDKEFLHKILDAFGNSSDFVYGMQIRDAVMQPPPRFRENQRFMLDAPVLLKKGHEDGSYKYITYKEPEEAARLLTLSARHKMEVAKLPEEHQQIQVRFDPYFEKAQTKLIKVKQIQNLTSLCPILADGTPEAMSFLWSVGIGNSTGAGFGALK